jgi:hypothetical protein
MVCSCVKQDAARDHTRKTANKSFESAAKFKYLGTTRTKRKKIALMKKLRAD